jgi:hypothetical protein
MENEWCIEVTHKFLEFLRQSDYRYYVTDADIAVINTGSEEGFDNVLVQYGLWLVANS